MDPHFAPDTQGSAGHPKKATGGKQQEKLKIGYIYIYTHFFFFGGPVIEEKIFLALEDVES